MQLVDVVLLCAFVLYAVTSGLRARRRASEDLEQYFLAGRSLGGVQAGMSMAATQFAADTPLLVTGLIATAGVFSLWRLWIYAIAFLLLGFVLAGPWRRARVLTDAELTELRYAGGSALALRTVKALYFGTVFNCIVLAWVLLAATRIAEPFLLWDVWLPSALFDPIEDFVRAVGAPLTSLPEGADVWRKSARNLVSILAIVAVTLFYSATGGLRSVVRTDALQLVLMLAGTAAYAFVVVDEIGGREAFSQVDASLRAFTPSRSEDVGLSLLFVFGLQWLLQVNADGTGYLAQRTMACRDEREARHAALVFTGVQIVLRSLLWLPIGVGLLILYPAVTGADAGAHAAAREMTFVHGMQQLLPPGLLGLMLTAMLAALASTVDTHLNWGASYWTNDIFRRLVCEAWLRKRPSDRSLVWVARLSNGLILALALVVMTQLSSIQGAWQASLLLGSGVGVVLVLRWLWWRMTGWGELSSLLASLVLAPLLLYAFPEDEPLRLLLCALGATTTAVGVALVFGPEPAETLVAFYRRAKPPGLWGPVASSSGTSPRAPLLRLARGLGATGLGALSFFCALVGIGSWLIHSPPPVWLPSRSVFIGLTLVVGAALVPVWWRLGMARHEEQSDEDDAPRS